MLGSPRPTRSSGRLPGVSATRGTHRRGVRRLRLPRDPRPAQPARRHGPDDPAQDRRRLDRDVGAPSTHRSASWRATVGTRRRVEFGDATYEAARRAGRIGHEPARGSESERPTARACGSLVRLDPEPSGGRRRASSSEGTRTTSPGVDRTPNPGRLPGERGSAGAPPAGPGRRPRGPSARCPIRSSNGPHRVGGSARVGTAAPGGSDGHRSAPVVRRGQDPTDHPRIGHRPDLRRDRTCRDCRRIRSGIGSIPRHGRWRAAWIKPLARTE